MNRVHSLLDKYDVKCDYNNIFGVKGTRWLKSLKLIDNDQILLQYVMQIEFLNTEIKNIKSKITCQASKNESDKYDRNRLFLCNDDSVRNWRYNTSQYTRKTSILVLCPSIHQSGNSLDICLTKTENITYTKQSLRGFKRYRLTCWSEEQNMR